MIRARTSLSVVLTFSGLLAAPIVTHAAAPSSSPRTTLLQRYVLTASDVRTVLGGSFVQRTADTHGSKSAKGLLGVYVVSFTPVRINGGTGTVVSGIAQAIDSAHAHAAYDSTLPLKLGVVSRGSSTRVSRVRGVGDEANVTVVKSAGLGGVGTFQTVYVTFHHGVYAGIVAIIFGRSVDPSRTVALAKIMAQRVP